MKNLVDLVLLLYFSTSLFVWGSSYVQGFEGYPYWRDLGPHISNEAFLALRSAHYWKIYPLAVYPGLLALLANAALVVLRPPQVDRRVLAATLVLNLVVAAATFLLLVPIQDQLDVRGYDRRLIEDLIHGDFWWRKVPGTVACGFVLLALWQVVTAPSRRGRA